MNATNTAANARDEDDDWLGPSWMWVAGDLDQDNETTEVD